MNRLTRQIIAGALKDVGIREVGYNDGPEIGEWLRRVNRKPGRSYCAAWAWCKVDDACQDLGLTNPMLPTAGVHLMCRRAKALGAWTKDPGPGFIGMHDSGLSKTGARLGHCGIILEVGEHHVQDVEANTNEAGSREGDCVAEKPRPLAYWDLGYFDPGKMCAGQTCSEEHPEDG